MVHADPSVTLEQDLARRDFTINAIAPGGTDTDMATENAAGYQHPRLRGEMPLGQWLSAHGALGRLATPEEIAAGYAYLASDDAAPPPMPMRMPGPPSWISRLPAGNSILLVSRAAMLPTPPAIMMGL